MSLPNLHRFIEATVYEKIQPYTVKVYGHPNVAQNVKDRKPSVVGLLHRATPYALNSALPDFNGIGLICKYTMSVPNQAQVWTDDTLNIVTNVASVLQNSPLMPESSYIESRGEDGDFRVIKLSDGSVVSRPGLFPVRVDYIDFGASIKLDAKTLRPAPMIAMTIRLPIFLDNTPVFVDPEIQPYVEGTFNQIDIVSSNNSIREFTVWREGGNG